MHLFLWPTKTLSTLLFSKFSWSNQSTMFACMRLCVCLCCMHVSWVYVSGARLCVVYILTCDCLWWQDMSSLLSMEAMTFVTEDRKTSQESTFPNTYTFDLFGGVDVSREQSLAFSTFLPLPLTRSTSHSGGKRFAHSMISPSSSSENGIYQETL